jgi:hypothetical protein
MLQAQGLYTQLVPTLALYGILVQRLLYLEHFQFCVLQCKKLKMIHYYMDHPYLAFLNYLLEISLTDKNLHIAMDNYSEMTSLKFGTAIF